MCRIIFLLCISVRIFFIVVCPTFNIDSISMIEVVGCFINISIIFDAILGHYWGHFSVSSETSGNFVTTTSPQPSCTGIWIRIDSLSSVVSNVARGEPLLASFSWMVGTPVERPSRPVLRQQEYTRHLDYQNHWQTRKSCGRYQSGSTLS